MDDEILVGIFVVFIIGIFAGVGIGEILSLNGEIYHLGQRFVRVDAEPTEDWCEEWVCDSWNKTLVEHSDFCYKNECETTIEFECLSQSLVRRRC